MFNTTNIGQGIKFKTRQNSTRFFKKRTNNKESSHIYFEVDFNMQLFPKGQVSNASINHKKEKTQHLKGSLTRFLPKLKH
jgi:hypothetical protein